MAPEQPRKFSVKLRPSLIARIKAGAALAQKSIPEFMAEVLERALGNGKRKGA